MGRLRRHRLAAFADHFARRDGSDAAHRTEPERLVRPFPDVDLTGSACLCLDDHRPGADTGRAACRSNKPGPWPRTVSGRGSWGGRGHYLTPLVQSALRATVSSALIGAWFRALNPGTVKCSCALKSGACEE